MANFKVAFEIVKKMEFSAPSNALHQNPGESGLTFMGIYESAHPAWQGWEKIKAILAKNGGELKKASEQCYADERLKSAVELFYKQNFWDKIKGDELAHDKIAQEIFCMGVNAGVKTAIKLAQRAVALAPDGIFGPQTLAALNSADPAIFSQKYDELEINHYKTIIAKNPKLARFERGWLARARMV